ncbi:unnamed protein product [Larinioides sclopetarius]|uniref:Uncharacterized protein n=1 Tax=Larinioides sclopetarius TaxID=280406 RepID=A0AAV2BVT1_9ARAC
MRKTISVLRLKDAVTPNTSEYFNEGEDLSAWDQKKKIESRYGGQVYPARFLQFGLNKRNMDLLVDKLISGSISPEDVDIIQKDVTETTGDTKKHIKKRRKEAEQNIIDIVKQKPMVTVSSEDLCRKCQLYKSQCDLLVEQNITKEKELQEINNLYSELREKYASLKKNTKY